MGWGRDGGAAAVAARAGGTQPGGGFRAVASNRGTLRRGRDCAARAAHAGALLRARPATRAAGDAFDNPLEFFQPGQRHRPRDFAGVVRHTRLGRAGRGPADFCHYLARRPRGGEDFVGGCLRSYFLGENRLQPPGGFQPNYQPTSQPRRADPPNCGPRQHQKPPVFMGRTGGCDYDRPDFRPPVARRGGVATEYADLDSHAERGEPFDRLGEAVNRLKIAAPADVSSELDAINSRIYRESPSRNLGRPDRVFAGPADRVDPRQPLGLVGVSGA